MEKRGSLSLQKKPKRNIFENCPENTIPASAVFDPAIGKFLFSCRKAPAPIGKCVILEEADPTQSLKCPPDFVLMGSERIICCELKGIAATADCFRPKTLYSFKLGFVIPFPKDFAAVGRLNYGSCRADPTVFQIEICKLTPRTAYNSYHLM
ncbi:uncharacterized protein LOC117315525 isoform X2 [Pecten maximus]|uniref:uncharacterized protein LOC117315525 isoform X2 n=1 Tax=Pecten maximus TaxID=6579 RepID=UPI00145915D2|nr:uncharacterized protein LOC117315525 isoform X2 [Pecten maximus]